MSVCMDNVTELVLSITMAANNFQMDSEGF